MSKFLFYSMMVIVVTCASNRFLSDFPLKKQQFNQEVIELNEELKIKLKKRLDYLSELKANHCKYSIYGFIVGLIIGHCVGCSIDKLFKTTSSKYTIPLTAIGPFFGCAVFQAYYSGVAYVIARQSDRDHFLHNVRLIEKYNEFFKDLVLLCKIP